MAVNDIFKKVPIEVPNKSGHDMSNEVLSTMKVGTLVPIHTDLLLPNDTVSLGASAEIQLPPMATDFYGRVKAHLETFFVPCRLLYGGWQDLMTHPASGDVWPSGTSNQQKAKYLPSITVPISQMAAGSLSDYLGYGFGAVPASAGLNNPTITVKNPLKYLAYHKIWNDFYRDSRIQQPAFARAALDSSVATTNIDAYAWFGSLPYYTNYDNSPYTLGLTYQLQCADGVKPWALRQRCFGKDYFTNASPLPQAGQPASVAFGINNNQGAFTIASLRAANALQTWMERCGVAGYRYGDNIRAHFGVYPSDAALDRPLYLGRQIIDVYNKTVYQQDENVSGGSASNNPFMTVGSKYGSPLGVGSGSLCNDFTATEHGYLMTIFSLVPDSIYSDTLDRDMWYNNVADFPFPLLQGVGDQEISLAELVGYLAGPNATSSVLPQTILDAFKQQVFGYTQRYSEFKFKLDKVHGLLKDTESLQAFALQRSFSTSTQNPLALGSSFLEIPTNYLDNVAAVQGDVSKYGCWADIHFNYHKVSTLAAYSIPTLGEPKNTHTEVIDNGGVRL